MKFIRSLFLFIALFTVFIVPTNAQFSLLPEASKDANCKQLLNAYEIDRRIPTKEEAAVEKAEDEYSAAVTQFEKKSKDYETAVSASAGCYCGTAPPEAGTCKDKCLRLKEAEEAKANADAAQASAYVKTKEAYGADLKTENKKPERDNLLGCAIKTGRISLAMIPYFISHIINFLLAMTALIAVLFIVIGGYQYVYGGLGENKDKAKKTITHALIGMAVAILAWSIVNVIINAVTG